MPEDIKKTRHFFCQPYSFPALYPIVDCDDGEGYIHVEAVEHVVSMALEQALEYLVPGCAELLVGVEIHEDDVPSQMVDVAMIEACCPSCPQPSGHVLTVGELSALGDMQVALAASTLAARAGQELRQFHISCPGMSEYRWAEQLPREILLTCPRCGKDYVAVRPDAPTSKPCAPAAVEVGMRGERVTMRAMGDRGMHRLELDTGTGLVKLDGRTLLRRCAPVYAGRFELDFEDVSEAREIFDSALSSAATREYAWGLLPPDAQVLPSMLCADDGLVRLASANRFRGYPVGFYEDVARSCRSEDVKVRDGLAALPVRYNADEMERTYSMLALPRGQKRLRRDIFQRPILVALLVLYPDLPFSDPNILHELITAKDCKKLLATMTDENGIADVWFFLSELFGDKATFGFLRKASASRADPDEVDDWRCDGRLSVDAFDPRIIQRLRGSRMADVYANARALPALGLGASRDALAPIEYSVRQMGLEVTGGEFAFMLPKQEMQLVEAGQELKNCLGSYVGRIGKGKNAIVLMFDLSRPPRKNFFEVFGAAAFPGRLVAATEVDRDCKGPLEARTSCNGRMPEEGPLASVYEDWLEKCGLSAAKVDDFVLF